MNRRTALMLTMLSGSLWPARVLAQSFGNDGLDAPSPRRRRAGTVRAARRDDDLAALEDDEPFDAPLAVGGGLPSNFPVESGHSLRTYDITRYTGLPHSADSTPQNALIEWIFRRTGSAAWHGDKIAVLCASRAQLRAYHDLKTLKIVDQMVQQFTDAQADFLTIRVNVVSAADPRWRYLVYTRMASAGSGPQGQQAWVLKMQDAAMVRAQMGIYQGFKPLYDRSTKIVNGQTLKVELASNPPITYIDGPRRDSAVGLGFQPGTAQLEEGVTLRLSPLLNYEGDAIDAAIDLKVNLVRRLHSTKILTRREIGPVDMSIDVPEAGEARFNQTIHNWKLGHTLLISSGIQPGILQAKGGLFNLHIPGTMPTTTELLVFLDAEVADGPPRTARSRNRAGG